MAKKVEKNESVSSEDEARTDESVATEANPSGEMVVSERAAALQTTNNTIDNAITLAAEQNVEQGDLVISRLAIIQPQSPEITNDEPGYQKGQVVDNVSREILSEYGPPPWMEGKVAEDKLPIFHFLRIVPIFALPHEFIHWKDPNTEGNGWHFKTLDKADERVRKGVWPPWGVWRPDPGAAKKSPPVSVNINQLVMAIDGDGSPLASPMVATFSRTSTPAGKRLTTACKQHRMSGLPWWGRVYYLYTANETRDRYSWYEFRLAKGELLSKVAPGLEQPIRELAAQLADQNRGRELQELYINSAFIDEGEMSSDSDSADDVVDPGSEQDVF